MIAVDGVRLLAFLRGREETGSPLVYAIYRGLADRVVRGDFAPVSGGGMTAVGLGLGAQVKTAPESVGALNPGPKTTPLELEGGAS